MKRLKHWFKRFPSRLGTTWANYRGYRKSERQHVRLVIKAMPFFQKITDGVAYWFNRLGPGGVAAAIVLIVLLTPVVIALATSLSDLGID